jgi:coenzyme F420-0:L-glutamate ligase/coenzyme F420-1:gamma-L-glutamate ligase
MVEPGQDLAALIADALRAIGLGLVPGDVVVVSQKIVSKSEGRLARLSEIRPSERARRFAEAFDKDAALVELALSEASEVLRMERGHLITSTGPGWICANSGIDQSNQNGPDQVSLLPVDPDASAARLRSGLAALFGGEGPAVVISDTFGRPWRLGQIEFAIGAAGFEVLEDHAGRTDLGGRQLEHTQIALADELAAAAGLVSKKADGTPVVLIRGCDRLEAPTRYARAADLIRPRDEDLFR